MCQGAFLKRERSHYQFHDMQFFGSTLLIPRVLVDHSPSQDLSELRGWLQVGRLVRGTIPLIVAI